jgi:hypothetical protein
MQNVTLYSLVDIYSHAGGMYYLHLHSGRINQALRKRYEHMEGQYRKGKLSEPV